MTEPMRDPNTPGRRREDGMPRRRHYVQTVAGESVEVLVRDDLDDLKDVLLGRMAQLTRWLVGVGLLGAFSLGFWANGLRNELNDHATAIAAVTESGGKPVQAIREELAATRERMAALQSQMERLENLLDRRQ